MRITYVSLASPEAGELDRYASPPLAAGYLAAYARSMRGDKDEHTILDADQPGCRDPLEIVTKILATAPQVVAFSVYNWNRVMVMKVTRLLSDQAPRLTIALGGPEVAFDAAEALRESGADWVCAGEGEIPFTMLLDQLEGNSEHGSNIPAMVSQNSMGFSVTSLVDPLDRIPSPFSTGILKVQPGGTVNLETMRGCPWRCNFCLYGKNYSRLRYYSLGRVKADLELLVNSEVNSIYIIDPTFNHPRERCLEICRILSELNQKRQKKIFVEVKAEYIDEEMADAFVNAGIAAVEVGLQSTNPAALTLMGRRFDLERFINGTRLLREREIWANIGVIAGLPGDQVEQFMSTLRFVSEQALGRLLIYPLQVFPGSVFHRDAQALGLKFRPSPSYQVTETPLISSREMREIIHSIPDLMEEMNQPYLREMSRPVLGRLRTQMDSGNSVKEIF